MKLKKNGFGYTLWVFYYIVISITLSVSGVAVMTQFGISEKRFIILLVCLFFAADILFFFLFRSVALYLQKETKDADRKIFVWIEGISAVFLIAVAAAMRIGYIHAYALEISGDTSFYEMAKITENSVVPWIAHNASYFYTRILSFLFSFFGNRPSIAVYFQAAVQVAAIVLFYFAVRKLTGRTASLFFLAAAAFLPEYILNLNVLSPEIIVCFFMGIGLIAVTGSLILLKDDKLKANVYGTAFFVTGMLVYVNAYLDIHGFLLFMAASVGIILIEKDGSIRKKTAGFCCLVAGFLLCGAGLFWADSYLTKGSFVRSITGYLQAYMKAPYFSVPLISDERQLVGSLILSMLAGLGVIGFWKQKWDKSAVISVLLTGSVIIQYLHISPISYTVLNGILWSMAAAVGIQYFADLYFGKAASEGVTAEKLPELLLYEENTAVLFEEQADEYKQPVIEKPEMTAQKKEFDMSGERQQMSEEVTVEEKVQIQVTEFIPNPLPLPRKHVKKELDYSFEPEGEKMEFDLVDSMLMDHDDFDIE